MLKIYDNILTKQECDHIESLFLDEGFPWYYQRKTYKDDTLDVDMSYLGHCFITSGEVTSTNSSIAVELLKIFVERTGLKFAEILRIQANYTTIQPNKVVTPKHIDSEIDHYVLIYYVNDSDGDTILYGDKIESVSPQRNRFILFDGDTFHSATSPQVSDKRIVINYNLKK